MLLQSDEKRAEELMQLAKHDVQARWQQYRERGERDRIARYGDQIRQRDDRNGESIGSAFHLQVR